MTSRRRAVPEELFLPLTWSPRELEELRRRTRELMGQGLPRSVACRDAFGELVSRRALERARDVAKIPPEPAT